MTLSRRLLLAAPLLATPALAQRPWPDGPIRLVAPFPPGGSADLLCRLLQNPLQAALGVPIVVENKPGASGALGTASVARAAPDGQSFVLNQPLSDASGEPVTVVLNWTAGLPE